MIRGYQPITATFTDPASHTVFTYNQYYSGNQGPFFLSASGTFTLTLTNYSGSAVPYDFDMIDLGSAASPLGLDTPVGGSLDPGLSTLVYTFDGTAGQTLFLDNTTPVGNPVYLTLIDPSNRVVSSIDSYSDSGPLTLTSSGTFYLLVDGESSSPTTYGFRLIDTSTTPLTFGAVTNGTVTVAAQSDVYTFSGKAGDPVYFEFLSQSNGFDGSTWTLFGPQGQTVTSTYYPYDLGATLPVDGTYTLAVYNNTGYPTASYSFEAFQNADPTTTITPGQVVSDSLANPGDSATYTFQANPGDVITYVGLDPYISGLNAILRDPNGSSLFNNNAYYGEGYFSLAFGGTYSLTVYSSGRATGDYSFVVNRASDGPTLDPTAGSGTAVAGTLSSGIAQNYYVIQGTAGERLYFEGQSDSPSYSADLYLSDAANHTLMQGWVETDNSVTLPATGTYYLDVVGTNLDNTSVSYGFELFKSVDPTTTITPGQTVIDTLADPGDQATYTFDAKAGQRIYFDALDPYVGNLNAVLTNPNGSTLFNYNAAYDEGVFDLAVGGTYTLTVYGNGRTTGDYAFSIDDVTTPPAVVAPVPGTPATVSGTLASGGSVDYYRIDATAGERLYFEGQADSPSYTARYNLYDAFGNNILNNWAESDDSITLPRDGSYLLVVAGQDPTDASGPTPTSSRCFRTSIPRPRSPRARRSAAPWPTPATRPPTPSTPRPGSASTSTPSTPTSATSTPS